MKRFSFLLLASLTASLVAQPAPATSGFEPLKVLKSESPIFPHELIQAGVREGEARVAFSIDAAGNLEDSLAIAYTHPAFARTTLAALKHWQFQPARFAGQPTASSSEILVRFEVQGTVVVSLDANESIAARMTSLTHGRDDYRPRMLKELDRIPTPVAAPSPAYPLQLAQRGKVGRVTVSFYIDENGAVRLPSVEAEDDPTLAAAAIDALRRWKFEPPTCRGVPVLVKATQQFNFRPPTPSAPTTPGAGVTG